MRILLVLIVGVCMFPSATADSATSKTQRRNQKKAEKIYLEAAESIRAGGIEKGRRLLDDAMQLDPTNPAILNARELLRQQDVQQIVLEANQDLVTNQHEKAIDSFRKALLLDSGN